MNDSTADFNPFHPCECTAACKGPEFIHWTDHYIFQFNLKPYEGKMSHTKCIVCLQKSTQIPSEYFQFSNQLLIKFLNSLSTQINGFEFSSDNSFPFCSRCRVYLAKFAKLNDKLESLASNLRRLEEQQTVKFKKISSLQRQILKNDTDIQDRLRDSWNDQQKDEHVQKGLATPEIFQTNILSTSEIDNIDIAKASDWIEIVDIADDDSNVPTNLTGSQTNGQPLLYNEDNSDKGASSAQTMGGENVETLDQRTPRSPAKTIFTNSVEQLSQKNFIYKAKYPFERTVSGFKCGSCQATSEVCKAKGSSEWNFIIGHIRRWHLDSDLTRKVSTSKKTVRQKCQEAVEQVSETKFMYKGKHAFELVDADYKCGSCPATSKVCTLKGLPLWHFIILHIEGRHTDSGNTQKASTTKKTAKQKRKEAVEQVSEKKFIYEGKYPFERVDVGYKCGSCPATSKVCKLYRHPLWHFIVLHIETWHLDSDRVRKQKVHQRCIEIAPGQFQYGDYSFEKLENKWRCLTCGYLAAMAKPHKNQFRHIIFHIIYKHANPEKPMCELCGKQFGTHDHLKRHKTTQHSNSNASYPCSSCEKTFKTQSQALQHEKNVHNFQWICEICGQKFRSKSQLQGHIGFSHNGERMFKCDECGKAYANRNGLDVHKNSHHTGIRKYICDICGMNFTQQYAITRHKKTVHKK